MTPEIIDRSNINLAFAPVGVLLLKSAADLACLPAGIGRFKGTSYCEALKQATDGTATVVGPDSIEVCRWSPPVLGLKEPESDFEKEREPRLPFAVAGVFVCRLDRWPAGVASPDVVNLRADRDQFRRLIALIPPERIYRETTGVDRTAIPILLREQPQPLKARMVRVTNTILGRLNNFTPWHRFTIFAFKHELPSRALNFILDRAMANMSICRNSTVIPYLGGQANFSHFCTGGICWGKNPPSLMTAGLPWQMYSELRDRLSPDPKP